MVGGSSCSGRSGSSRVMAWAIPPGRFRPQTRHAPESHECPAHTRRFPSYGIRNSVSVLLVVALVMIALLSSRVEASGCEVEHCTQQFQQAPSSTLRRVPSTAFCVILRQYSDCLRSTARSCRGHLAYHSTITLVQNWNLEFNCSYVGASATLVPPKEHSGSRRTNGRNGHEHHHGTKGDVYGGGDKSTNHVNILEPTAEVFRPGKPSVSSGGQISSGSTACTYQDRPDVTHCSFYGDPHLVTFNGEFQTCKVAGAWPLIDNAYLAVSVTNEAVVPGSAATATTKITIIIKGSSDCTPERTYEAAVDSVPASFVDGSQWGGPVPAGSLHNLASGSLEYLVPVRIVEKEPGRHVEIHARHLGATLIVRQVGRYLTFAARLPRDVAEQGASREGLQLCVKGCPASERIDISSILGGLPSSGRFHRQSENSLTGMNRDAALALCREYNLTDYYLDSCMFDLITTGDPSFSLAASRAQSDFIMLSPSGVSRLSNRTWPATSSSMSQSRASSASSIQEAHGPGRPSVGFVIALILSVLSLLNVTW